MTPETKEFLTNLDKEIERRNGEAAQSPSTENENLREGAPYDDKNNSTRFIAEGSGQNETSDQNVDGSHQNDDAAEDEGQKANQPKNKKESERLKKRLQDILYENQVLQEQLAQTRFQHQQALVQTQSNMSQHVNKLNEIADENKELKQYTLEAERQRVLAAYKAAKQIGDEDLEIDLQEKLTRVIAAQTKLADEMQYDSEGDFYVTPAAPPSYGYQAPVVPAESENFRRWKYQNTWADRNHVDYDPQRASAMANIFEEAERYYTANGRAALIDSAEFYNVATDAMNSVWEANQTPQHNAAPQHQRSVPPNVAPVSRPGGTMADQYASQDPSLRKSYVHASPEELRLWRNMRIRNPDRRAMNPYLTPEQSVQHFYNQKLARLGGKTHG